MTTTHRAVEPSADSTLHFFDCLALAPEPWANGAGETRTIARDPDSGSESGWRVSLASLTGAARFSQFAGFDRILLPAGEDTVELHTQDGQLVARRGQPVQFPGELHVWLAAPTRPTQVVNVMTRRTSHRATLSVVSHSARIAPASTQLLIALSGKWSLQSALLHDVSLAPLCGIWLEGHDESLDLQTQEPGALLASIAIEAVGL